MGEQASRSRTLAALITGVAAAALLGACGGEDRPPNRPAASGEETRAARGADGMPRAAASVVALKAQHDGARHTDATATVVDGDRAWLLTSNHNVEGAKALTLTLADGTAVAATVLARAPCDDVALLGMAAKPPGLIALKPAASDRVKVGERVMTLGFPVDVTDADDAGSAKLAMTSGAVAMTAANVPLTSLLPALHGLLGHQAPVSPGFSGGPLLTDTGRMIGLTVSVGTHDGPAPSINMSFATSGTRVAELLRQLTPRGDGQEGYTGWRGQHRCHDGMVKLASIVAEPDHDQPAADSGSEPESEHRPREESDHG